MIIVDTDDLAIVKRGVVDVVGPGDSLGRPGQVDTGDHQSERSNKTRGEFHNASPCDECERTICARTYRTPGLTPLVTVRNDSSLEHFEACEISSNTIPRAYSRTKKSPATKVARG